MQWRTRPAMFLGAEWRHWFAWRPVRARVYSAICCKETWVWLERIERRREETSSGVIVRWDYRIPCEWWVR